MGPIAQSNPMSWLPWVLVSIVTGFFAILYLLIPIILFVTALMEKHRLQPLTPLTDEQAQTYADTPSVIAALAAGLQPIGAFQDNESNFIHPAIKMLLTEDRRVLMQAIVSRAGKRYVLLSRMADGHWLVSTTSLGFSGICDILIEEAYHGASVAELLRFHESRLAQWRAAAVPFVPETLVDDLLRLDRERATILTNARLARYVTPQNGVWVFTLKGAVRVTAIYFRNMSRARAQSRAKAHKRSAGGLVFDFPREPRPVLTQPPAPRQQLLQHLAHHGAIALVRPDNGATQYVTYQDNDAWVFPLFSSQQEAAAYLRTSPQTPPCQCLPVSADWLTTNSFDGYRLVLNPKTAAQLDLTPEDLEILRSMQGAAAR